MTLLTAAAQGRLDAVQAALAKADVEVDVEDEQLRSSVMLAAQENLQEITRVLIKHEFQVDVFADENYNALLLAAGNDHVEIAMLLLDHGADMHAVEEDGLTAFMLAAQEGPVVSSCPLQQHSRQHHASATSLRPVHAHIKLPASAPCGRFESHIVIVNQKMPNSQTAFLAQWSESKPNSSRSRKHSVINKILHDLLVFIPRGPELPSLEFALAEAPCSSKQCTA